MGIHSCVEYEVDLLKPVDDFDKNRKDVRILTWENGGVE